MTQRQTVIEIKNIVMIQLVLVELVLVETSWNQWFLLQKIFCIRRFRKKKMFSEIWPQSQGSRLSKTHCEEGRQCGTTWRLVKAYKAHNFFRKMQLDFYQASYNLNQTYDIAKQIIARNLLTSSFMLTFSLTC